MRLALKDYQIDAVRGVLANLRKARSYYRTERDLTSFSLSATTGAGKTVMAAAVIEALFFGNDDYDIEGDPGAVVLWFSDSPDLNRQSLVRVESAASELDSRLVEVRSSFNAPKLDPQTVYFLNRQKLSKTSSLVRGHVVQDEDQHRLFAPRPDEFQTSFFDTLRNTLEDPDLTLYLVVDEAHKGLDSSKSDRAERSTILHRLISGADAGIPTPVVWGVSATVDRFTKAMEGIGNRTLLQPVRVDSALVQASGLLKDDILLDIPAEAGPVDTVLLKRAARKLLESDAMWTEYSQQQSLDKPVVPLMVVQVPNNSDGETLREAIDTILTEWPDMPTKAVAHVFGEHKDLTAGQWPVPYISPERVQETSHVRILFAKDAVSTGWDCPRAEVLMSFRSAVDRTHITQLLGRMVRTPIQNRVPGNDVLNSVLCVLPKFDRKTATEVAQTLMRGATSTDDPNDDSGNDTDTGGGVGRRVLFDPQPMRAIEAGMEAVWAKFLTVPSETLPRKNTKPVKRLTALAQALAADGLLPDAGAQAHQRLHEVLDGRAVQYKTKVDAAVANVKTVEGTSLRARMGGTISHLTFTEAADHRVIRDAYQSAGRVFSASLTHTYAEHLAGGNDEDALWDAYVQIAGLSLVPDVAEDLDSEADKIAAEWFNTHRVDIKQLPDSRQQVFNDLLAMATEPQRLDLVKPTLWQEDTKVRDTGGVEAALPTRTDHLLVGDDGTFPVNLNGWETEVVDREMARPGAKGWFRNPARSNASSLAISYRDNDVWKTLRPDFLFFTEGHGEVQVSIVDPHGHHLRDALPKLRGLAHYAAKYGAELFRVEAISKIGDKLRVLDLTREAVRNAVMAKTGDAEALYTGPLATDY